MRKAYFATNTIPARKHESVVKLLTIFAQHLAIVSNQILVRQENAEPPVITKLKNLSRNTKPKTSHCPRSPKL
jgi:hypothetical protein